MSVISYQPWGLLNRLHGDIDRLLDTRPRKYGDGNGRVATSHWVPAVDIREDETRFVIHVDVPGVDPKDIEVHMEDGVLSVKGQRSRESKEEREGYKRMERVRGEFLRRFSLPDTADADAISATCRQGVLEIVIPKQEKLQPKRSEVEG